MPCSSLFCLARERAVTVFSVALTNVSAMPYQRLLFNRQECFAFQPSKPAYDLA
jgi:hypothetical protein